MPTRALITLTVSTVLLGLAGWLLATISPVLAVFMIVMAVLYMLFV